MPAKLWESEPPRRLVLKWRHEMRPELKAEGYSRMTYELEQNGDVVKFTVHHEIETPDSKFIKAVSGGWPMILSSLKEFPRDRRTAGNNRPAAQGSLIHR